jgi:hypothetical protein
MSYEKLKQTVQAQLVEIIVKEIAGKSLQSSEITIGALSVNYFSFVFSLEITVNGIMQKLFVKIPKEDLRFRGKTILPISNEDRKMAEAEINSLQELANSWKSDNINVSWVRLKATIPEYNAIVTEAAFGTDLLDTFRKWDLGRRIGLFNGKDNLISAMKRLGTALGRFHNVNAKPIDFKFENDSSKLRQYCSEITSSISQRQQQKVFEVIDKISKESNKANLVYCLKGIDIRNILINNNMDLFLLDPGRLKSACHEADLARFIMTYRILYWGSKLFFLRLVPSLEAEKAFYDAYYQSTNQSSSVLQNYFLMKEQIKHWHTAIISLKMLKLPGFVKWMIEKIFINPYYVSQLNSEIKKIKLKYV